MSLEKQDRTPEEIEFWSRYGLWPKPEQLKNRHGGKRQGSGRPSTLKNPIRVTITLEKEQKQFCLEQGELSQVIRALIQEKMNLKKF